MKFNVTIYREVAFVVPNVEATCMEEAITKALPSAQIGKSQVHNCDGSFIGALTVLPADEQHASESRTFLLDSVGSIKRVHFNSRGQ